MGLLKLLKSERAELNEAGFVLVDGIGKDDIEECLDEIRHSYEQHFPFDFYITPGKNVGVDEKYAFFARSRQ